MATIEPYFWEEITRYKGSLMVGNVLGPVLYVASVFALLWLTVGSRKCWLLLILAPICFGPLLLTLYTFVCWKFRGFAP
jgi:hypothetical protein